MSIDIIKIDNLIQELRNSKNTDSSILNKIILFAYSIRNQTIIDWCDNLIINNDNEKYFTNLKITNISNNIFSDSMKKQLIIFFTMFKTIYKNGSLSKNSNNHITQLFITQISKNTNIKDINEEIFEKYDFNLSEFKKYLIELKNYKDLIKEDSEINNILKEISEVFPEKENINISTNSIKTEFDKDIKNHFTSIDIANYKIFDNFKVDKLNKINIFAGLNNCGKTTFLEAVYLLSKQNDLYSFFELLKFKNKATTIYPNWLNKIITSDISISGDFNNNKTSINIIKFQDNTINKKSDYITSYKIQSFINKSNSEDLIHTFQFEPLERRNSEIIHLCKSIFKSPYFFNLKEVLKTHNSCVENKSLNSVIDFIKKIDKDINDINITSENDLTRFVVDSDKFKDKTVDLTTYGEGLQRVFEIALSFAYAENGIICIDEFETAIHKTLLLNFIEFIYELSERFNVQVFLTTHSKECIDSFVQKDKINEKISAYLLENKNNIITTKHIEGKRLKYLSENISLDIRGDINE